MKKLLSFVLAFALVFGLTPMVSAYTGNVDYDDIVYPVEGGNIYFDKATGTITGAEGSVTSADIPATIDGVAVKTIGESAFEFSGSLTSIAIPNSVTTIGELAFAYCQSLTSITIPSSVTTIGARAFEDCGGLASITIPDSVMTIGESAFEFCGSLTSITIPNSVTTIGELAFAYCQSLTSITIPDGVTSIGDYAFFDCESLTSITIPDGVTTIGWGAFECCQSLTSIAIPDSVTTIEEYALNSCCSLADIYYGGTQTQWEKITVAESNDPLLNATIHFESSASADEGSPVNNSEYLYNEQDPAEDMTLPTDALENVDDIVTATGAVNTLTSGMTAEQKTSAVGIDLATLFAETAVSKAASKAVSGNEIIINAAAVKELEATAASAAQAVETALVNGGVSTGRYIANTVTLTTDQTGKITIKVDPDILTTTVDKIRVETPKYALTLKVSDLKADLSSIVTISAESMDVSESGSYALGGTAGASSMRTVVALDLPGGHTTNSVTLSFPSGSGKGEGEAVVNESGAASTSKYNPATVTMDGKVNTSGKYTIKANEKDFTDIANKSAEMQNAIRYLASKGIINGTSETTFSPDGSISRAEIAALVVRALGKLDSTATASFTDVTTADWYYSAAASSQKNGIINGYTDNTFKGKNPIVKQEIVAVAARVLKNEMNYKEPTNTQPYLAKYSDTVAGWAQPEVALATRENLIVYRVDGTFSGAKNMTRGDAAIIIYRLFQHIW